MKIKSFYEQRLVDLSQVKKRLQRNLIALSASRLLIFLLTVFLIYFFWNASWHYWGISAFVGFSIFLSLIKVHSNKQRELKVVKGLIKINEDELKRLRGDWKSFEDGSEFRNPGHPFSEDLSIFGVGSLFQYISRAGSAAGKRILANALLDPSVDPEEINRKLIAHRELAADKVWLQEFMANINVSLEGKDDKKTLELWASGAQKMRSKLYHFLVLRVLPAISILMVILTAIGVISFSQFLLYLLIPFGFVGSQLKNNTAQFGRLSLISDNLYAYQHLFQMVSERKFSADYIKEIMGTSDADKIVFALNELNKIADAVHSRNNIFVGILLNALLVWDLQCDYRLRKWQNKHSESFTSWFKLIWTLDSMGSFAVYLNNHPDFVEAEFQEGVAFSAEKLAHPLLSEKNRISNDFDLSRQSRFAIITGANMAGKSTFLRAVGVNMILARAGVTICAAKLIFEPVAIFSSMQTTDNLSENESFFFSELKRLKQITDRLDTGEKLFLILDEILKGTNSRDKAEGSARFMRRILKTNCNGIIATHDLSLCNLADEFPGVISNQRFEVEFEKDELIFDYKLQAGVCENMNATFLLHKMGLTD